MDNSNFLREKHSVISRNVDKLITHTVPYDCNYIGFSDRDMRDLGSKELREAVATRNIRFLVSDRSLFSDGVHPNAEGARLIAEKVYKTFKRTLPEHPRHREDD